MEPSVNDIINQIYPSTPTQTIGTIIFVTILATLLNMIKVSLCTIIILYIGELVTKIHDVKFNDLFFGLFILNSYLDLAI